MLQWSLGDLLWYLLELCQWCSLGSLPSLGYGITIVELFCVILAGLCQVPARHPCAQVLVAVCGLFLLMGSIGCHGACSVDTSLLHVLSSICVQALQLTSCLKQFTLDALLTTANEREANTNYVAWHMITVFIICFCVAMKPCLGFAVMQRKLLEWSSLGFDTEYPFLPFPVLCTHQYRCIPNLSFSPETTSFCGVNWEQEFLFAGACVFFMEDHGWPNLWKKKRVWSCVVCVANNKHFNSDIFY